MPGDYLSVLAMSGADEATLDRLRAEWGLDEPLYVQYYHYVSNMLSGDMGVSHRTRQPVLTVTGTAILNSFILIAPAITVAYLIGSVFGTAMGVNRGSKLEKHGIIPVTVFGTVPGFFLGVLFLILFSFYLGWLPSGGMMTIGSGQMGYLEMMMTIDFWKHFILPFLTIVLNLLYLPTLTMRTSTVEILGQDFIRYHRAKGLRKSTQLKHIMKHASLPIITLYPISMSRAIGGLVVIEMVFNWPGIGYLLLQSVFQRDYPVVQFVFFLIAIWVILGNYVVDLLYSVIDPRVTVEEQEGA